MGRQRKLDVHDNVVEPELALWGPRRRCMLHGTNLAAACTDPYVSPLPRPPYLGAPQSTLSPPSMHTRTQTHTRTMVIQNKYQSTKGGAPC
jgi:hypothetical protein